MRVDFNSVYLDARKHCTVRKLKSTGGYSATHRATRTTARGHDAKSAVTRAAMRAAAIICNKTSTH